MKIEDIRLGMLLVTSGGIQGKVVAISKEGGLWLETEDRMRFPVHVECVRPTDESCTECQKLEEALEYWQNSCMSARQDADYWQQKYTDREMKPLAEVAKCYKQVEPEQLLLSAEARRVVEYLRASDRPLYIHLILEGMERIMSGTGIMDGLIEAKEAGIVRLDDGKYSIVRE